MVNYHGLLPTVLCHLVLFKCQDTLALPSYFHPFQHILPFLTAFLSFFLLPTSFLFIVFAPFNRYFLCMAIVRSITISGFIDGVTYLLVSTGILSCILCRILTQIVHHEVKASK